MLCFGFCVWWWAGVWWRLWQALRAAFLADRDALLAEVRALCGAEKQARLRRDARHTAIIKSLSPNTHTPPAAHWNASLLAACHTQL